MAILSPHPLWSRCRPHEPAYQSLINEKTVTITWSECTHKIERILQLFKEKNLASNTTVCFVGDIHPTFLSLLWSFIYYGICIAPLNRRASTHSLLELVQKINPHYFLCSKNIHTDKNKKSEAQVMYDSLNMNAVAKISIDEFHDLFILRETFPKKDTLESANEPTIPLSLNPESKACLLFTSGSEGAPKGVYLTNKNLFANFSQSSVFYGLSYRDQWCLSLPVYHVGGFSILIRSAFSGASTIVLNQYSAESVKSVLLKTTLSHLSLVYTTLNDLIKKGTVLELQKLRCILLGGASVEKKLHEAIQQYHLPVSITYGMTETASHIAATKPGSYYEDPECVGEVLPLTEVKVEKQSDCSEKTSGRIFLRGNCIYTTSLSHDSSPEERNADAWYTTNDIGYLKDGFLFITGRADDIIFSGAEKISLQEIEKIALTYPGVLRVLAKKRADATWQERPTLYIQPCQFEHFQKKDFEAFLLSNLDKIKIPDEIVILEYFPLLESGKIDMQRLTERSI
jgi:o-succinylbenzoate---CoA ligase